MSTDNRYQLSNCDQNTGWAGDDTASVIATAGSFLEGAGALSTQLSNAEEQMHTTEDDTATGTYSFDLSDSTCYATVKDNLHDTFANGGMAFVVGDGTNLIGYYTAGNDAQAFPVQLYFRTYKVDLSVHVASPGANIAHTGTEASLAQTTITQMGYGSLHLAKAVGAIDNAIMDGLYYLVNGSYALTINAGTVGTPETMTDVVADDEASGWSIVNNPKGSEIGFFAPTEWGAAAADSYFTSDAEQWYLIGDNQGGHEIGAGNFPFRLFGDAGSTNSWAVLGTVIVNTGARSTWLMDDANMDTIQLNGCQMANCGTIGLPSSGGTTRETLDTIFANCDQITNNGADMDGSSILVSNVAADTGALLYNEASDPDGTLDNLTFTTGAAAHHSIDFGTNVDSSLISITLRGIEWTGFGAVDDANASTVRFLATTGALTLNLIDCTVDGVSPVASGGGQNFSVDDAAGMTVTVVVAPVTLTVNVADDDNNLAAIQNAQTSIHLVDSPFTELMNEDTTVAGVASESYAGVVPVDVVVKVRKSEDTDNPRYFPQSRLAQVTSAGLSSNFAMKQNTFLN